MPLGVSILWLLGGVLSTATIGMIVGWLDRKVSARVQYRLGPPFFQNFNDFFKLLGKETILVREGIPWIFVAAPLVAFATLSLLAVMLWAALLKGVPFGGDLIVVMYLMMCFSAALVLGGASTGNVYASVGAGREIKLLLADELVFILACLVPVIRSGYTLRLDTLVAVQSEQGAFIGSFSGVMAFVLALLAIQAKMALPPFHIPEAETEIVEGPLMEYSGPLLAFWRLNQHLMVVAYPLLLVLLFCGGFGRGPLGFFWGSLKYLGIVLLMVLIKNTNPRIRIDTALRFFWFIGAPIGLVAVILAVMGV